MFVICSCCLSANPLPLRCKCMKKSNKMQKCLKFCKMLLYLLLQDETREGQLNFICTQKRWLVSRNILRRAYVVPFCFCRCKHSAKLPRRFDLRGFCFYLAYIFEIWERELIRVGSIIPTQLQPLQDTHRTFLSVGSVQLTSYDLKLIRWGNL